MPKIPKLINITYFRVIYYCLQILLEILFIIICQMNLAYTKHFHYQKISMGSLKLPAISRILVRYAFLVDLPSSLNFKTFNIIFQ